MNSWFGNREHSRNQLIFNGFMVKNSNLKNIFRKQHNTSLLFLLHRYVHIKYIFLYNICSKYVNDCLKTYPGRINTCKKALESN